MKYLPSLAGLSYLTIATVAGAATGVEFIHRAYWMMPASAMLAAGFGTLATIRLLMERTIRQLNRVNIIRKSQHPDKCQHFAINLDNDTPYGFICKVCHHSAATTTITQVCPRCQNLDLLIVGVGPMPSPERGN